jgi:hypothetical protein
MCRRIGDSGGPQHVPLLRGLECPGMRVTFDSMPRLPLSVI